MGILRRIQAAFLLLILCTTLLALPAAATTTTSKVDGWEITAVTEKEMYEPGEPITITFTIKNTSSQPATFTKFEQLIPEGYKLSGGTKAAVTNVELRPGGTAKLKVTFESKEKEEKTEEQEGFLEKLLYGETMGMPNLLLAVLLVIAFAIFMYLT